MNWNWRFHGWAIGWIAGYAVYHLVTRRSGALTRHDIVMFAVGLGVALVVDIARNLGRRTLRGA